MMMDGLLEDLLKYDADDYVRSQLLGAAANLTVGSRYFTYKAFNVRLDADSGTATVEDELDVDREVARGLEGFLALLREERLPHA